MSDQLRIVINQPKQGATLVFGGGGGELPEPGAAGWPSNFPDAAALVQLVAIKQALSALSGDGDPDELAAAIAEALGGKATSADIEEATAHLAAIDVDTLQLVTLVTSLLAGQLTNSQLVAALSSKATTANISDLSAAITGALASRASSQGLVDLGTAITGALSDKATSNDLATTNQRLLNIDNDTLQLVGLITSLLAGQLTNSQLVAALSGKATTSNVGDLSAAIVGALATKATSQGLVDLGTTVTTALSGKATSSDLATTNQRLLNIDNDTLQLVGLTTSLLAGQLTNSQLVAALSGKATTANISDLSAAIVGALASKATSQGLVDLGTTITTALSGKATSGDLATTNQRLLNIDNDTLQLVGLITSLLAGQLTNAQLRAAPLPVADSGELEYLPGPVAKLVTDAGDTPIYTPSAGMRFRIHKRRAVPAVRGTGETPVITIKLVNVADSSLNKVLSIETAVSERKLVTAPAGTRLVVNLDLACLVPCNFDIEEFPA